jgi:hypothetical protein
MSDLLNNALLVATLLVAGGTAYTLYFLTTGLPNIFNSAGRVFNPFL